MSKRKRTRDLIAYKRYVYRLINALNQKSNGSNKKYTWNGTEIKGVNTAEAIQQKVYTEDAVEKESTINETLLNSITVFRSDITDKLLFLEKLYTLVDDDEKQRILIQKVELNEIRQKLSDIIEQNLSDMT